MRRRRPLSPTGIVTDSWTCSTTRPRRMPPFDARRKSTPGVMTDWKIEWLDRTHDRDRFTCGKGPLDDFIRRLVSQYEKRNLGRTYVAARPAERTVCGYYTLASGAIEFQDLPQPSARKLPKHPVPVILLARLAVDRSAQGQGLGEALLLDALD